MVLMLGALILSTVWSATVKDCGVGISAFTIQDLSLSPLVPVSGQNVTLGIQYSVPSGMVVTDGIAKYSVTYNFIPFPPTTESLCSNIPCPLTSGTYSNATTSLWPTGLSGSLTTKMTWLTPDSQLLLCVSISGKVVR